MAVINFPLLYIPDPVVGRPLFGAQIYVGEPDLDPEISANRKQLNIVQEDGTVVPVGQPFLLSAGGVPLYDGANCRLDVDGRYSIKILSQSGEQKYYIKDVFEGIPITESGLTDMGILSPAASYAEALSLDPDLIPVGTTIDITDADSAGKLIVKSGSEGSGNGYDIVSNTTWDAAGKYFYRKIYGIPTTEYGRPDVTGASDASVILDATIALCEGKTLLIPAGTYRLDFPLFIKNTSIICEKGVVLKPSATFTDTKVIYTQVHQGRDNFWRGGRIDFTNKSGLVGFEMTDYGWTVERMQFLNGPLISIKSLNFSNTIRHCYSSGATQVSYNLAGSAGSGAHDNVIERCTSVSAPSDVFVESGTNVSISKNVFQECTALSGKSIEVVGNATGVIALDIHGNYIEHNLEPFDGHYIHISGNVSGKSITKNSFTGRVGDGSTAVYDSSASPISITDGNNAAQVDTFYESAHSYGGIIQGNIATSNVNTFVTGTSASKYNYSGNNGFVSQKRGSSSIASGNTSVVVAHGLSVAPTATGIRIVQTSNSTNNINNIYITSITSSEFTVNVRNDPGSSGFHFNWRAEYGGDD